MDHTMFDRLARHLATGASRRNVVRGAFAAAAGSALVGLRHPSTTAQDVSSENCTPEGKRCGRGRHRRPCSKCCTRNVITDQNGKRRCSCVRLGNDCSNDSQCCEGVCLDRTCQVSGPTCVPLAGACAAGDICCTGTCLDGTCGLLPICLPLQAACVAGDTCCAGACDIKENACCLDEFEGVCTVDEDCCSPFLSCDQGTCRFL